jgi:hypothetical protein
VFEDPKVLGRKKKILEDREAVKKQKKKNKRKYKQ